MMCANSLSILVIDASPEETKQAEGGYIKVGVKNIDSSAVINH